MSMAGGEHDEQWRLWSQYVAVLLRRHEAWLAERWDEVKASEREAEALYQKWASLRKKLGLMIWPPF